MTEIVFSPKNFQILKWCWDGHCVQTVLLSHSCLAGFDYDEAQVVLDTSSTGTHHFYMLSQLMVG